METSRKLRRRRLALVTWGHFLNDCFGAFLAPILPLLIEKLSLSLTTASGLASIGSITSAILQPLYGIASDRLQRRFFVFLGPLLSTVCMSLIGIAPNAALLGGLLLLAGVGSAAFHTEGVAAAGAVSGDHRGFGISLFIFGGNVAIAVGPLAIIGAVYLWGLERSYYVMIPGLLSALVLGSYLWIPRETARRAGAVSLTAAFRGTYRTMALLFSIAVIREFTRLAVVTFLPIFMALRGRSLAAGGLTLALFALAGALGGMLGGWLSDRWSRKYVILTSGLFCVPFLHGIFLSEGWVSLACLVLASATLSGSHAVVIAYAQELVPARTGTASSLVMGLGWGTSGVLLIAFGGLAESIGVPRALDIAVTLPLLTVLLAMAFPGAMPKRDGHEMPGDVLVCRSSSARRA